MSESRGVDLLAFLLLAALVIGLSYWRLRVYHQVTVWDVVLTRTPPNGTPEVLAAPEHIRRSFSAIESPPQAIAALERDIAAYVQDEGAALLGGTRARLEWRIRYSHNGTGPAHEHRLVFDADGSGHR